MAPVVGKKKELFSLKSNRRNLCIAPSNRTVKYLHLVVLIFQPLSCFTPNVTSLSIKTHSAGERELICMYKHAAPSAEAAHGGRNNRRSTRKKKTNPESKWRAAGLPVGG